MSNVWKSSVLLVLSVLGGGTFPGFLTTGGGALVALGEVISDKVENGEVRGAFVTEEEMDSKTGKYMKITAITCVKATDESDHPDEVQLKINDKIITLGSKPVLMFTGDTYKIPKQYVKNTYALMNQNPKFCLEERDFWSNDDLGCVVFNDNYAVGEHEVQFASTEVSRYTLTVYVTEGFPPHTCRWNGCGHGGCRTGEWEEMESKNCCWVCGNNEYCCQYVSDDNDLDSSFYPDVY